MAVYPPKPQEISLEFGDERLRPTPHQVEGMDQMPKENPKNIQQRKEGKTPYEHMPFGVLSIVARVLAHGAAKYGHYNWREQPILASTYKAALMRHLEEFSEGRWFDPDSGEPHLAHMMACCMVALDADLHCTLQNDLLDSETKEV